ncbi:MAG: helix-turn-helix domain-containing protein, partial [Kordiimonadaceae bacterium]|nr:helix-turn-helix domain-containing protein [Kordiimonadaceae bacterium]
MTVIPSTTDFEELVVTIGDLIQKRRGALGLSQKEAADRAELSLSALKQYETNRSQPPLDKAVRLAEVLKINPRAFFDEMGVPNDIEEQTAVRTPDAQLLKVLTELSDVVGAQVVFNTPDAADDIQVSGSCDELDKLRNLAIWKGIYSRHMPSVLAEAEAALWSLDMDEIEAVAAELELSPE